MNEKKYRYTEKQKIYYKNLSEEKKLDLFYKAKNRLSDEYKFLKSRYCQIKQKYKNNKHFIKDRTDMYTCNFTMEDFLNHWEKHKKKYGGLICAVSGLPMTHIGLNNPSNKYKRNYSNISVDRLDSDQPYTLKNIIFVRWDINLSKGDLSIKHMKKIISLYNEKNFN
tara:strand:+ start:106 stop:606 length:501 start_codon:yes stop_codon:yes gene_type:complete